MQLANKNEMIVVAPGGAGDCARSDYRWDVTSLAFGSAQYFDHLLERLQAGKLSFGDDWVFWVGRDAAGAVSLCDPTGEQVEALDALSDQNETDESSNEWSTHRSHHVRSDDLPIGTVPTRSDSPRKSGFLCVCRGVVGLCCYDTNTRSSGLDDGRGGLC